jgi:uncharacterized protein YecT (DUF1311 family)
MFCKRCGAELPNQGNFCRSCGTAVDTGQTTLGVTTSREEAGGTRPHIATEEKGGQFGAKFIPALVLFILIGLAVRELYGIWVNAKNKELEEAIPVAVQPPPITPGALAPPPVASSSSTDDVLPTIHTPEETSTEDASPVAPSFDCSKASSSVEKQICGDPTLAKLDVELSRLYSEARRKTNDKKKLEAEEANWITNSRDVCGNTTCIAEAYQLRISELSK